jgi:hypothetical protein
MGTPKVPPPVMLFVATLIGEGTRPEHVEKALIDSFGPLEEKSHPSPWSHSTYYQKELGDRILRQFLFFQNRISQDQLAEIKQTTNILEEALARPGHPKPLRTVNLDPGYLTPAKVVLATTKDYSHRIYLRDGIFAEVTLQFSGGSFRPLPHTYPDYRSEETITLFNTVRRLLLKGF